MTATESQPLTEEEMTRLHNAGFACPDHFPPGTIGRGHADDVLRAVERIIAARTAALLDRLKAAEEERNDLRVAMDRPQFTAFVAKKLRTAEANKARAVAESKVTLLDEVERRIKDRLGVTSRALPIVRALREEVSGS